MLPRTFLQTKHVIRMTMHHSNKSNHYVLNTDEHKLFTSALLGKTLNISLNCSLNVHS